MHPPVNSRTTYKGQSTHSIRSGFKGDNPVFQGVNPYKDEYCGKEI